MGLAVRYFAFRVRIKTGNSAVLVKKHKNDIYDLRIKFFTMPYLFDNKLSTFFLFFSEQSTIMSSTESCNWYCKEDCREGYVSDGVATCWEKCGEGDVNVGAMCRKGCREGYKETTDGICWFDTCPPGQERSGARCYEPCPEGYKEEGCCLCRERCRGGYTEVAGVCWSGIKSYVPKTVPRKSDGKLLSYVPATTIKDTYIPTFKLGLYPKIIMYSILFFVVMGFVIQVGAFAGVLKSFVVNTGQITKAVFQPLMSVLRRGGGYNVRRPVL